MSYESTRGQACTHRPFELHEPWLQHMLCSMVSPSHRSPVRTTSDQGSTVAGMGEDNCKHMRMHVHMIIHIHIYIYIRHHAFRHFGVTEPSNTYPGFHHSFSSLSFFSLRGSHPTAQISCMTIFHIFLSVFCVRVF